MPVDKNNTIFSEISTFFKKNDSQSAIFTIMESIKSLRMSEKVLFGEKSGKKNKYTFLQVFQILLMFPGFMIKNPFNYEQSSLSKFFSCGKDVFYRFTNNENFDWRKILYHITLEIWKKVRVRSDGSGHEVCLMVDDTDFPKTGRLIENMGRVFSHLRHQTILGFKSLFLGITDGKSQFLLDFAILGEEGKKKNFSMSAKELSARYSKDRGAQCAVQNRISVYKESKIKMMIEMIKRAIKKGIRFDYVLADSWFACSQVIRFIRSRHITCHYLGMIKVGERGKTHYRFEGNDFTAPSLIRRLEGRGELRYSRKLRCHYMKRDMIFADTKVRVFFVRRNRKGPWNGLMTTDLSLDFFEAYRIYAMRWSLEVVFSDTKGLLGLGKCQSQNFASQIAATTLTALQYNILSLSKRFSAYETIGGLFHDVQRKTMELSVTDRIWGIILEMVAIITELFCVDEEDIFVVLINKSEVLARFIDFYKLKFTA